tara:strand:+ start:426 stop:767 length:342 start_codon:yes stop_codon:yes gene_type:complete
MNISTCDLASKQCKPYEKGAPSLSSDEIGTLLLQLKEWQFSNNLITKLYKFKNYYETMAFVNMVAWVAHREDHHPDMTVGYNKCQVEYTTHTVKGLSENDFICAAKIDKLFKI